VFIGVGMGFDVHKQAYVARLISAYVEISEKESLPKALNEGSYYIHCGGYVVDMLFAGPFLLESDAEKVCDALNILWMIGGLLGYGAVTGFALSFWWPICVFVVVLDRFVFTIPNNEITMWMLAFGWLGVFEAPMLFSSLLSLIAN
jgi:hypothetical protein